MSRQYTEEEVAARIEQLFYANGEILKAYSDILIAKLHENLELNPDFNGIRFVQGQIAGIRDFCSFIKE